MKNVCVTIFFCQTMRYNTTSYKFHHLVWYLDIWQKGAWLLKRLDIWESIATPPKSLLTQKSQKAQTQWSFPNKKRKKS